MNITFEREEIISSILNLIFAKTSFEAEPLPSANSCATLKQKM